MDYKDLEDWIKDGANHSTSSSHIWQNIMRNRHWLFTDLCWEVGNGVRTGVSLHIMKFLMGSHIMLAPLLQHLHYRGMFSLSNIVSYKTAPTHIQSLFGAIDLDLTGSLAT